ncbi:hypothetical protein HDV64DRAFT_258301 [Trichoderma sp. TUCIM 5745]
MSATPPHSPTHYKLDSLQPRVQYLCFRILQGSSKFTSKIKLGENASLNQGNTIDGSPPDGIKQDGSEFGGEIEAEKSATITQGNRINGQRAEASKNESSES